MASARRCLRRAHAAMPASRVPASRRCPLPRGFQTLDGHRALSRRARRGGGARRGLPRPEWPVLATCGDAADPGRVKAATELVCSVGIGPNKLVAKVASDAEKPAGFVVLTREQACERFADAAPGLIPGIGPKTVARLEAMGLRTWAGSPCSRASCWSSASVRITVANWVGAHTSNTTAGERGAQGRLRVARAHL